MFAEQRIEVIKNILRSEGEVSIAQLCDEIKVSDVTVRKYLDILEKKGFLKKVHGGAVLVKKNKSKSSLHGEDRYESICQLATSIIHEYESVYIGPGLAGIVLAKKIAKDMHLSVITNNLEAVTNLTEKVESIYCLGGAVYTIGDTHFLHSSTEDACMEGFAVGQAFICCDGFDLHTGFTTRSREVAIDVQKRLNSFSKINMIMLPEDYGIVSLHKMCPISNVNAIITGKNVPDELKEFCYSNNIQLYLTFD